MPHPTLLIALRMDKMIGTCVVEVAIRIFKLGLALVEVVNQLYQLGLAWIRLVFVIMIGLRISMENVVFPIGLGCVVMFMIKVGLTPCTGDFLIKIGLFHSMALLCMAMYLTEIGLCTLAAAWDHMMEEVLILVSSHGMMWGEAEMEVDLVLTALMGLGMILPVA